MFTFSEISTLFLFILFCKLNIANSDIQDGNKDIYQIVEKGDQLYLRKVKSMINERPNIHTYMIVERNDEVYLKKFDTPDIDFVKIVNQYHRPRVGIRKYALRSNTFVKKEKEKFNSNKEFKDFVSNLLEKHKQNHKVEPSNNQVSDNENLEQETDQIKHHKQKNKKKQKGNEKLKQVAADLIDSHKKDHNSIKRKKLFIKREKSETHKKFEKILIPLLKAHEMEHKRLKGFIFREQAKTSQQFGKLLEEMLDVHNRDHKIGLKRRIKNQKKVKSDAMKNFLQDIIKKHKEQQKRGLRSGQIRYLLRDTIQDIDLPHLDDAGHLCACMKDHDPQRFPCNHFPHRPQESYWTRPMIPPVPEINDRKRKRIII